MQPGEEVWITLELRYVLLGKTEAKWDLDLGNDRHIFLTMVVEGLSGSENKLHLMNDGHFKFQHIYFGDKNPIYQVSSFMGFKRNITNAFVTFLKMFQVCWIRNATNHSVSFSVNRRRMREINQKHCYKLFSCATPRGIVNPRSSVPILLKFQPRQFGTFKVLKRTEL